MRSAFAHLLWVLTRYVSHMTHMHLSRVPAAPLQVLLHSCWHHFALYIPSALLHYDPCHAYCQPISTCKFGMTCTFRKTRCAEIGRCSTAFTFTCELQHSSALSSSDSQQHNISVAHDKQHNVHVRESLHCRGLSWQCRAHICQESLW